MFEPFCLLLSALRNAHAFHGAADGGDLCDAFAAYSSDTLKRLYDAKKMFSFSAFLIGPAPSRMIVALRFQTPHEHTQRAHNMM